MKRRPIEREYLATLNEVVDLTTWKLIVQRAVDDAIAGDYRARDWISKTVLRPESHALTTLAAQELKASPQKAADDRVEAEAKELEENKKLSEELDRLLAPLKQNCAN